MPVIVVKSSLCPPNVIEIGAVKAKQADKVTLTFITLVWKVL